MTAPRSPFTVDANTRDSQRRAADPRASAWVSANAGAGKTKVLTDRVLRLLLNGTPPARILCLTFTKAAAANMSNRVFGKLGGWVTLDDAALSAELESLSGEAPSAADLRESRRLFARAVETPGGLKIETLHALCERLLHNFPFEANVPAGFAVLDDRQSAALLETATAAVLADAFTGTRPDLRGALGIVGAEVSGDALRDLVRGATSKRHVVSDPKRLSANLGRLGTALGFMPGDTQGAIVERILLGGGLDRMAVSGLLRTGSSTDETLAGRLVAIETAASPAASLDACRSAFFTAEGKPRAGLGTKKVPADAKEALLAEQERLAPLFDALRGAEALARTGALFTLATDIHRRIEAEKAGAAALDFDDLIHKTLDLLRRVDASWVLYKLDRGIDHVLVDEAQDTNPLQWGILRALTSEFVAGKGAREANRTRFAVGDPKQSIYGFQGAEPREFESTHRDWRSAAKEASLRFEDVSLNLSFRSTGAVLRAVDEVFAIDAHLDGLSFEAQPVRPVHASARVGAPGAVELWPIEIPAELPEADAWTDPVDAPDAQSPAIVTARRVAQAIRHWTTIGDAGGVLRRPGDILVLVRKRSLAFEEVIRALKGQGVPVAGQDRLEVAAHIAVADLVAIGRAGLLPADDLTLATALKTPLVGLDDDDLMRIAARRLDKETLEDALIRHAEGGDAAAQRGLDALRGWIALAAREGPFGFYAALLSAQGGRAKLVARLGGEAGDAIDVFLGEAAKAEQGLDAPSLSGFLTPFGDGSTPLTVKRDMEAMRDEVRVMTVHGAKGLEAPLVVLIDGCEAVGGNDPPLIAMDDPGAEGDPLPPVWSSSKTFDSEAIAARRAAVKARARQEHNRLLYVAMTRAADHLVIAPYRGAREQSEAAWCEMVRIGLEGTDWPGEAREMAYGPITLWAAGDETRSVSELVSGPSGPSETLPDWLDRPVPEELELPAPLSPSRALGAADPPQSPGRRQGDAEARRRGVLLHALLEHLPVLDPAIRAEAARRYVEARAPGMEADARARLVRDAVRLMDEPDLAPLFAPGSRPEVSLTGMISVQGIERPVFGRIDRLAISDDAVLFCDFKTSRPPAEGAPLPMRECAQLALYARLLGQMYPDRAIQPILVWTSGPTLRRLSEGDVAAALAAIESQ